MKKLATTLLIGALLAVGSAAQAADRINASGFSLAWMDGVSTTDDFSMNLLSDANGTARIGLSTGLPEVYIADTYETQGSVGKSDFAWSQLFGSVQPGYRISSMTLSGVVKGWLYVQPIWCDACVKYEGEAASSASINWALTQGEQRKDLTGSSARDVNGEQLITSTADVNVEQYFTLDLYTAQGVYAKSGAQLPMGPGWSVYQPLDAKAVVSITDYMLTVQVVPVPEPSTYAMLLAGLGVAGWAARRRKG